MKIPGGRAESGTLWEAGWDCEAVLDSHSCAPVGVAPTTNCENSGGDLTNPLETFAHSHYLKCFQCQEQDPVCLSSIAKSSKIPSLLYQLCSEQQSIRSWSNWHQKNDSKLYPKKVPSTFSLPMYGFGWICFLDVSATPRCMCMHSRDSAGRQLWCVCC